MAKKKKETNRATIERMQVGTSPAMEDTWLAPYAGCPVIVITHPDGWVSWIMEGENEIYEGSEYVKYFEERTQ